MKSFVLACSFVLAAMGSHAQGSLAYQTTLGVGKEKYIFRCDPSLPFGSLYPGIKLEGPGFTAELWYAMGEGADHSSLMPVPGSQVGFRSGTTAGLIQGKSKLDIPGTYGGDKVTLQLRVWNNEGGSLTTWDKAFEKGLSHSFTHVLSGVDRSGSPQLGTGNIAYGLASFVVCVPEPSVVALGFLGLGSLVVARRRS